MRIRTEKRRSAVVIISRGLPGIVRSSCVRRASLRRFAVSSRSARGVLGVAAREILVRDRLDWIRRPSSRSG